MTAEPPGPDSEEISWAPDRVVSTDEVPDIVAELADGARITWVWQNALSGRTYRLDRHSEVEYVKWSPDDPEIDFALEAEKLEWAGRYVVVPPVLGHGRDSESSGWLHTAAIPGTTAVAPVWKARPEVAARAIGQGLRALHDRLPLADCRWGWEVADRAPRIKKPDDRMLVDQRPVTDRLVVCHGDACSPNTLIGSDGRFTGHVDFGSLGVADRWADLAIATYAVDWNFDVSYEDALLDAYGIERDDERIDYYRRLWDAT